MTNQAELWDMAQVGDVEVPRARQFDPETSHRAANSMQEEAGAQRCQIEAVLESVPRGLIYHEISARLGWKDDPTRSARRMSGVTMSAKHPDRQVGTRGERIGPRGRSCAIYVHRRYLTLAEIAAQTGKRGAA